MLVLYSDCSHGPLPTRTWPHQVEACHTVGLFAHAGKRCYKSAASWFEASRHCMDGASWLWDGCTVCCLCEQKCMWSFAWGVTRSCQPVVWVGCVLICGPAALSYLSSIILSVFLLVQNACIGSSLAEAALSARYVHNNKTHVLQCLVCGVSTCSLQSLGRFALSN
jgi:hypothetical protein